jgi:hypothetical protein
MQRNQIIKLAEEAGLLFNKDVAPYSHPAQQRLISRLEKFARSILEGSKTEEENSLKNPIQDFE